MPSTAWVSIRSPAKLNLFLDVLGRRPDGYHDLVTLMTCVSLSDRLWFRVTEENGPARVSGPGTPDSPAALLTGETVFTPSSGVSNSRQHSGSGTMEWPNNLVFRALDLLRQASGTAAGMDVRLVKCIPLQAGLGGGSSNAATALIVANRLWGLNWPVEKLAPLAAAIGSDVPFFLYTGMAVCRGRGERIDARSCWSGTWVVIGCPPEGLATAKVFGEWSGASAGQDVGAAETAVRRRDLPGLGRALFNGLEAAASRISGWPARFRREFDRLGCLGHQLTGSGSCYFGLFSHREVAARSANLLRLRMPAARFFLCQTSPGPGSNGFGRSDTDP